MQALEARLIEEAKREGLEHAGEFVVALAAGVKETKGGMEWVEDVIVFETLEPYDLASTKVPALPNVSPAAWWNATDLDNLWRPFRRVSTSISVRKIPRKH